MLIYIDSKFSDFSITKLKKKSEQSIQLIFQQKHSIKLFMRLPIKLLFIGIK